MLQDPLKFSAHRWNAWLHTTLGLVLKLWLALSHEVLFCAALAYLLNCGFVPVRKFGKLPGSTVNVEYALEYGTNVVEVHTDAVKAGQRVLIVETICWQPVALSLLRSNWWRDWAVISLVSLSWLN